MRIALLTLAVLALTVPAATAQPNHHPVFLFGGHFTTSPSTVYNYATGVFRFDNTGSSSTVTKLFDYPYSCYEYGSMRMDVNNTDILFCTRGSTSTLYPGANSILRYDSPIFPLAFQPSR